MNFEIAAWDGEENLIQWTHEGNKMFPHSWYILYSEHDINQVHISSFSGSCLGQLFKILVL